MEQQPAQGVSCWTPAWALPLPCMKNISTLTKIFEHLQNYLNQNNHIGHLLCEHCLNSCHQSNPVTVSDKSNPKTVFVNKGSKLQENSEAPCEIFKMGKFFHTLLSLEIDPFLWANTCWVNLSSSWEFPINVVTLDSRSIDAIKSDEKLTSTTSWN